MDKVKFFTDKKTSICPRKKLPVKGLVDKTLWL